MFDKKFENIKNIDEKFKKSVGEFAEEILKANPNRISSICVYGNRNILVALNDEEDFDFFCKNSKTVKKFHKKNIISLFITKKHIQTSQDVFPLEFLDIKKSCQLIYGDDFCCEININMENLRLQAEQQIKGLLIRFYQLLLEIGDDKRKIRDMINNSLDTIFAVFRGMVFLKQNKYLIDKNEILDELKKNFGIDLITIKEILNKAKRNEKYDQKILNSFIKELQDFAYLVDGVKL